MNEETLILYYYDDGLSESRRREVAAAIAKDPDVSRRYQLLCSGLDGLAEIDSVAAPTHLVARWHDSIDRAAEQEAATATGRTFHFGSFFWGATVTASLALGIAIGVYMSGDQSGAIDSGTAIATLDESAPGSSTALSRGLMVHFQESRDRLVDLSAATNGSRSALIMDIIHQNRLYQRAAMNGDSQDLARVLRALEPILLRLADENISPEDAMLLQAQLAFELNIVLTKLSLNISNSSDSIET